MVSAKLIYFKTSGKYYEESKLPLLSDEIANDGTLAVMFKVSDRIRELSKQRKLPGLSGDWIGENGYIFVTVEDIGYPCLIHNYKPQGAS